jgi:hypothetical protein
MFRFKSRHNIGLKSKERWKKRGRELGAELPRSCSPPLARGGNTAPRADRTDGHREAHRQELAPAWRR